MRTELLFDSLLNSYKISKKDASHSYIHNSGSLSDIDHCIVSSRLICRKVHVDKDEPDYDHLPPSLPVTLNATTEKNLRSNSRKWISKREWNKADWPLYFSTLVSLLSTFKVPFNLLYTGVGSPQARIQLNIYYSHIVSCLKRSEEVAVPLCRFRAQTRSWIWKNNPELKTIQNRAKLWLKMWITCSRSLRGNFSKLKKEQRLILSAIFEESGIMVPNFLRFLASGKKWLMSRSSIDRLRSTESLMYHWSIIIVRFSIQWYMRFIFVLPRSVLICCLKSHGKSFKVMYLPFVLTVSKEV